MYRRSQRNFPLDVTHGPPRRGAGLRSALKARAESGTPDEAAELADSLFIRMRLWKLPEHVDAQNASTRSLENAQTAFTTAPTHLVS